MGPAELNAYKTAVKRFQRDLITIEHVKRKSYTVSVENDIEADHHELQQSFIYKVT